MFHVSLAAPFLRRNKLRLYGGGKRVLGLTSLRTSPFYGYGVSVGAQNFASVQSAVSLSAFKPFSLLVPYSASISFHTKMSFFSLGRMLSNHLKFLRYNLSAVIWSIGRAKPSGFSKNIISFMVLSS